MADRIFATNRRVRHDYHILDTIEAGLALTGTEAKAIRAGRSNLREAFARPENGELWLLNAHVAQYEPGNRYNHEPTRPRKLLLHKRELAYLAGKSQEPGITLVPLRLYDRKGKIKAELAVVRGKHAYDKRQAIAKREADREIDRAIKTARVGR